jgi:hypothetical protein
MTDTGNELATPEDENPSKGEPEQNILQALTALPLFDELFMRMQAMNLAIVDQMLEEMETALRRELIEIERTPMEAAMIVSAVSQMWLFALYELLRTWRQRAKKLIKIATRLDGLSAEKRDEILKGEMEAVRSTREDANLALDMQRESISRLRDPHFVDVLKGAFAQLDPIFRSVEGLRMTLAKHEAPKTQGLVAFAPGYGRIDYLTGSMYWLFDLNDGTSDAVNRRAIADELRRLKASE